MSGQNPFIVSVNVGTITNQLMPLFQVPTGFGGMTLIGGDVTFDTAGTAGLYIVNGGAAGTSTSGGTAATPAGTAYTAKTPAALTVVAAQAFFDEGEWIDLKESNVGTSDAITIVSLYFKWGK